MHFSDYLRSLTAAQAARDAALLWSAQGDMCESNERRRLFFLAWGRVDGPAAVAFVQANYGPGKVACLGAALAGWAGKNPAETKAWIDGKLQPHESEGTLAVRVQPGRLKAELQTLRAFAPCSHIRLVSSGPLP